MSLLFAVNFHFANTEWNGYFNHQSLEQPFLHYWSLSIEEQFYFIFPLLLFLTFRFLHIKHHLKVYALILILLLLASLHEYKSHIYYLSQIRFIELICGALLAHIIFIQVKIRFKKALFLIGLSGILGLYIFYTFSPKNALILALSLFAPSIFTSLVILGGMTKSNSLLRRFLESGPLIYIGKISFSLYLWHWVILSILRYFLGRGTLNFLEISIAIFIIFILSILTYKYIETPARTWKSGLLKSMSAFYVAPLLIFAPIYAVINKNRKDEFAPSWPSLPCQQNLEHKCIYDENGNLKTSGEAKVLVIGDSHSYAVMNFFKAIAKEYKTKIEVSPAYGCTFFIDEKSQKREIRTSRDSEADFCNKRNIAYGKSYKNYKIIIFTNYFGSGGISDEGYKKRLGKTIDELQKSDIKVYFYNNSGTINLKKIRLQKLGIHIDGDIIGKESKDYIQKTREFAESKNVDFIDTTDLLPKSGYLNIRGRRIPISKDNNHIDPLTASYVAKRFIEQKRIFFDKEYLK